MLATQTPASAEPPVLDIKNKRGLPIDARIPVKKVVEGDPWLTPYRASFEHRYNKFLEWLDVLDRHEGGIENFMAGYRKMGFNVHDDKITYREWAPGVVEAFLIGDFNGWNRGAHPMRRNDFGVWEIELPHVNGVPQIPHNSKVKISMTTPSGERIDRIPAWIRRATQDLSVSPLYDAIFWNPPEKYKFKYPKPAVPKTLIIYESHVGIAQIEGKVSTYKEFKEHTIPHIASLGYNCIQLMAIMEHPYYASFGYQVTSLFAPSSRFGTPEELMEMIDEAHRYGIIVLLDVVHSHASNNVLDGLNQFDGTGHQYFHEGGKGRHDLWDSRLYNYSSHEVLRFLLSNLRYYIEEFQFSGFRFDGVTSMLYYHHGLAHCFGSYDDYFYHLDQESVIYLMLANYGLRRIFGENNIVTIAEDVSGLPSLCRPVEEAGVGFDYRLGMSVPDMWIKLLKEFKDDDWDLGNIVHTLTNRRYGEKTITYCESHDQALVGDKTLAFWLMDAEMYTNMSDITPLTPVIDRGLALHKMIRLITYGLGGEGYLNFMGNEFGHPEWLDFPRAGNGNSYHYARRQYNLIKDDLLRYKYLNNFDIAMHGLQKKYNFFEAYNWVSLKHQGDKVVVFERGHLIFIFNFHPTNSYSDYRIGAEFAGRYTVALCSDAPEFGGHNRVDLNGEYFTTGLEWNGRKNWMHVYIPCRVALVLVLNNI